MSVPIPPLSLDFAMPAHSSATSGGIYFDVPKNQIAEAIKMGAYVAGAVAVLMLVRGK
jgi:hypothetical protein